MSRFLTFAAAFTLTVWAASATDVDLTGHDPKSPVSVTRTGDGPLTAQWADRDGRRYRATFGLVAGQPLLAGIASAPDATGDFTTIAENVDVSYRITTGERNRGMAWYYTFFDRVDRNMPAPVTHAARLDTKSVRVTNDGPRRVTLSFSGYTAGSFYGELAVRICDGSPLLQFQAVLRTDAPWCAYVYDVLVRAPFASITYRKSDGALTTEPAASLSAELSARTVRYRTIAGSCDQGTLAIFPGPHTGLYPTDYSTNFGMVQAGKGVIGTRMDRTQDKWRPWIDAPRGSVQRMDGFLLISAGDATAALDRVLRYTNSDVFKPVPGHLILAEHFHAALAVDHLKDPANKEALRFRAAMMDRGVNLVHLMEFHGDGRPAEHSDVRLKELQAMFDVCRETAVENRFLFIPGEEYNEFCSPGFHWGYLLPKPVYFMKCKEKEHAYQGAEAPYGKVYHIHNADEMLRLLKDEKGLAWVTHPRIKASHSSPDNMIHGPWYREDLWQAGDWKPMPADLSWDRLGVRSFRLMDDTAQWGFRKHMLGEVDTFKLDTTHELYTHLSANYLRLAAFPKPDDWTSVVECIRNGDYFTTTGEVLIHDWQVDTSQVRVELEWYFPPSFAQITWGESGGVRSKTISLIDQVEMDRNRFTWPVDLTAAQWVRFEAWDVARNGAFTQPRWLKKPSSPERVPGTVTRFALIDTDLGLPVPGYEDLADRTTLERSKIPAHTAIQVHTLPLVVGKVELVTDGGTPVTLAGWPYAPGTKRTGTGDHGVPLFAFEPMPLQAGTHTLTATAWTGPKGKEQPGAARSITLIVRE